MKDLLLFIFLIFCVIFMTFFGLVVFRWNNDGFEENRWFHGVQVAINRGYFGEAIKILHIKSLTKTNH